MVGVSHGNVDRVRELLALHPTLANAAWDWGFGDWETALGAASHVGHREIAELLLANGARPTLFSAAMLGQLEVVRALVAASPGVQKTRGPHGLTLLHHARAGGERAAAVARFLEETGGADPKLELAPLEAEARAALLGTYRFGPGEADRIEIAVGRLGLTFERAGAARARSSTGAASPSRRPGPNGCGSASCWRRAGRRRSPSRIRSRSCARGGADPQKAIRGNPSARGNGPHAGG